MSLFLKLFNTTAEYNAYTADTSTFIKPNVSVCKDDLSLVYYNPLRCDETSVYEIIGEPSYPSTVDGADSSFDIAVNYRITDINTACTETVTEGTDIVTVEIGVNPSGSASRTVSGTVDYHGTEIEYSITQSKFEAKITAKFDVTDTSNPTQIGYNQYTSGFSKIEIDGVAQPSVVSAYTFSTTGEHTVKYTLADPTSIGAYAFTSCSGLTSIVIPDSVTSIKGSAFMYCSGLTSIVIPDSVTSIGNSVFQGCKSLTSCTIGSGVTTIGSQAFNNCTSLTSIVIPDSVTSINGSAFMYCRGLESCTIGSGITSIGTQAFRDCRVLTSITIEATTPPTLGSDVFFDANKCTIYVPSGSVDAYKAASGWSTYASRIQAIP